MALALEEGDDNVVAILNRVIRWTEESLLYEIYPRRVEKLLKDMDMEFVRPRLSRVVKWPGPCGSASIGTIS